MAREWAQTTLGECIDLKHGFAFKGEFIHEEPYGDILLTPGNFAIGGGFKGDKFKYYSGPEVPEFILRQGDLLVSMTDLSKDGDTLGYPAFVPKSQGGRRFLHNQRLGKVHVIASTKIDTGFLHCLLRSVEYRNEILGSATGSTVRHTSPERIKRFQFLRPCVTEQRAIAHILGTLDDRIGTNRRMAATLEEMARALFRAWFVTFDPVRAKAEGRWRAGQTLPGLPASLYDLFPDRLVETEHGEIPSGWQPGTIYEAANVIYGAPFASEQFNTEGRGVPLIRIRDLKSETPGVWTDEQHSKGYLVKPGDIVVGMDGEFRAYLWGSDPAWLNQRVCIFQPKAGYSAAQVRNLILSPLAFVEATQVGTTVIHLGKKDIDNFKITVSAPEISEHFGRLAQPWYDKLVNIKLATRTLGYIRDLLLPKLVSGAIRVKDAEAFLKARGL